MSDREGVGVVLTGQPGEADPDVVWMLAFQRGDETCFQKLYDKYKAPLIGFALRFVRRRDLAEELAQEIFIKAYRAAASYRPEARFASWLFRIARNHCLNEARRPERRSPPEALEETRHASTTGSPEAEVRTRRAQQALDLTLARLPEKQRTALVLLRVHHLSYEEIAATLETSVGAVKSLLNRAREQLVEALAPHLEGAHDL
ncbi:MAG: sigma-70 family RNA polymerase sigma factor [Deltaproteobacteria bacterium]|nr:sigma-70 family RNA polymerase sigma factor [Deltaproteobacteria bacterium]